MTGRILVGVDGSPEARSALRWAAWYAESTGGELHAVHAWQRGVKLELDGQRPGGVDDLEACVEAELHRLVSELAGEATTTNCVALRGVPATAISSYAERAGIELIVVGTCGSGGARRALLGSVSRQLTESPSRAIAVIPTGAEPELAGRPIVVGVDGSDGAARALRWAAATAQQVGCEVVAVHAFVPAVPDLSAREHAGLVEEATGRLAEEWCAPLRAGDVAHRIVVARDDARTLIRAVADAEQPACVVVGSRGLGPLSQRLLGSITHSLVRSLDWPVVIVPSPRDRPIWPPGTAA